MDLIKHLEKQKEFSLNSFGPGHRTAGVIDHIRKELREIEENPLDLEEWIDLILLSFDGAWRSGATPEQIVEMLQYKLDKNLKRDWPDWRTSDPDKAIEHIKNEN